MQNRVSLLIIFMAAMLCGCQKSQVDQQLDHAESIIEEHPDSALTILQQIDGTTLHGEPQARHALLLSQAYDKNYIDLTNDSIINIAYNFYSSTSDDYHKMLASHYKATIDRNSGSYGTALLHSLYAYELAEKIQDTLNLSRIESLISRLYYLTYNYYESNHWERRSLEHAKALGKIGWVYNSYINIGDNYLNMMEPYRALAYLDSAQLMTTSIDPDILELEYLSYKHINDNTRADSIYNQFSENRLQLPLRVIVAYAEQNPENAIELLNRNSSQDDSTRTCFAYAKAFLYNGDIDSALFYLNQHIACYNQQITSTVPQSLNKFKSDYDQNRILLLQITSRKSHIITILIVVIALLCVFVLIIIVLYIRRRYKSQLSEKEHDARVLWDEFNQMSNTVNSYKLRISDQEENIEALRQQLTELRYNGYLLFIKQFGWIGKLGSLFSVANESDGLDRADKLYNMVAKELSLSSRENFLYKIENLLEEQNPELYSSIVGLGLIESERVVFICSICSLSTRLVATLTKKSERAIYNLKVRIRKKLVINGSSFALNMRDLV